MSTSWPMKILLSLVLAIMVLPACSGSTVEVDDADAGTDAASSCAPAERPNDPQCHDVGGRTLADGTACTCGVCKAGACEPAAE